MMTNLSFRQTAITNLCKKCKTTADIGCDHGYIGVTLLKNKKTNFLIASDISAPSAKKTKLLLEKENIEDKASIRVGDGLNTIKKDENPEQIIIAGMGGKEITHILSEYKNITKTKYFVFQPMNELVYFRKFLCENNLKIKKDVVIFDKKFYHIITASPEKTNLSPFKLRWGAKASNRDKHYFLWHEEKEKKLNNILKKLPKSNAKEKQILDCLKEIKRIKLTKGAKSC